MKVHALLFSVIVCALLLSKTAAAQQPHPTITFIRLNSYIGYVIDLPENNACGCIKFVGSKFKYGALILLPDSNVVFRMKVEGRDNFVDVPLAASEVSQISASAANAQLTTSDEKTETALLKALAGDTTDMNLMDYFELQSKSLFIQSASPAATSERQYYDNYFFLNIGLGLSLCKTQHSFLIGGCEIGYVAKQKQVFTMRFLAHKELRGLAGHSRPAEHIYEAGLLYGRKFDAGLISFTLNAGIMYASGLFKGKKLYTTGSWFDIYSNYESIYWQTFGIPVKAEMLLGNRHKSIASIAMFANFNLKNSYEGIMVCLRPSGEYKNPKKEPRRKSQE